MRKESAFRAFNFFVNSLLISAILLTLFGAAWEYSIRWYLDGFANAVLPFADTPDMKIAAILSWMERGPARESGYYSDDSETRDPVDTLNYRELLSVCGTATNAFVNLASAGGLKARRLLLLDGQTMSANHVVAEVYVDGKWIIVDPSFHAVLTDRAGRYLNRQELADPAVLQEATRGLPGYDPAYTYEHTAYVHLGRLPILGSVLQTLLNSVFPAWQERIDWTALLERQSYATIIVGLILLLAAFCLRRALLFFGRSLSMTPISAWEQLSHAALTMFSEASAA